MRVGIALGSNLGDRAANLQAAVNAIRQFAGPPVRLSRVYETEPVDCPPDSPWFLNAVIEIGYRFSPESLLDQLQGIERMLHREPNPTRNAPRPIDLDILYFGGMTLNRANLQIPHPRLLERAFVLRPLAEIAPDLCLPGCSETIAELAREVPEIQLSEFALW